MQSQVIRKIQNKKVLVDISTAKIDSENLTTIEKYAQIGQLSSGLIHDLISPITSLNMQIEILDENTIKSPLFIDSIKNAIKNINKYAELIKTYISGKKYERIILLDEEIQKALELISYKAIKNNIQIQFIRQKNIFMQTNPVLIYQIIISLVSNAIESFRDFDKKRRIIIKLEEKKKYLSLIVIDFGEGIKNIKKIFNPFYTTKKDRGGTGIGLSSVKHIVEKEFNGKIKVKSKIEKGSTFQIFLKKDII